MPYGEIVITEEAAEALYQEFGVDIRPNTYPSEKGDIGAVLARFKIDDQRIGLAVKIALDHNCYVIEPEITKEDTESTERPRRPQQLALEEIFRQADYDETYHLTPEGTRRRRRR